MTFGVLLDNNGNLIVVMLILYPISLPTILLINEAPHETTLLSLPISRFYYTLSKYLGYMFFSIALVAMGLIYGYLLNTYIAKEALNMNELFSITGLIILAFPIIVLNSLTYPVFLKYSKEKGSIVIILIISLLFLAVIIGLVYAEKTLNPPITRTEKDMFPVLMYYVINYIEKIGKYSFIFRMIISTFILLCASMALSLRIMYKKNIGGA